MFQPPKHLLQARKTSTQDQEAGAARDQEVGHNSHQTRGEEEAKDDNKEARVGHSPQQSPNPRRGGGQRRQQGGQSRPQSPQPLEGGEPLPFNLPPGAVPLNTNN